MAGQHITWSIFRIPTARLCRRTMLPSCSRWLVLARPLRPWRHDHTVYGAVVRMANLRSLLQSAGQEAKEATTRTKTRQERTTHECRQSAKESDFLPPPNPANVRSPSLSLVTITWRTADGTTATSQERTRTRTRTTCVAFASGHTGGRRKGGRGKSRKAWITGNSSTVAINTR